MGFRTISNLAEVANITLARRPFSVSAPAMNWSAKLQRLLENFDTTRINYCLQNYKPFIVADQQVGLIRPSEWTHLSACKEAFYQDSKSDSVILNPAWTTYDERSSELAAVLQALRHQNVFKTLRGWRNECYEVGPKFGDKPLMKMERSATCLFGIKRYGVHINGYVEKSDGTLSLWLQRRSSTKETFPNKLDNMVSGGFSTGLKVLECARKEAREEASVPDHLLESIKPSGNVSFIYEDERGVFPETIFVFDLRLPEDFRPRCGDDEVDCFYLLTVPEVKEKVVSEEFKATSKPIVLDFLMRHHFLSPDDEPNYCLLMDTIHMPLHHLYTSGGIFSGRGGRMSNGSVV